MKESMHSDYQNTIPDEYTPLATQNNNANSFTESTFQQAQDLDQFNL